MMYDLITSQRIISIEAASADKAKTKVEALKPPLPRGWTATWRQITNESWFYIVRNSRSIVQRSHCGRLVPTKGRMPL